MNKILYEVLCDKELLLLLCGGRYESPNGIMPYLSSTNIIDLGYMFGLPLNDYSMLARWDILKSLIKYCISKDIYIPLLNNLFDKRKFKNIALQNMNNINIEDKYYNAINNAIYKANEILFCYNIKLIYKNKSILLTDTKDGKIRYNNEIMEFTPACVKEKFLQIDIAMKNANFQHAITLSRTLLEEAFCIMIENKNIKLNKRKNINDLYSEVRKLYKLNPDGLNEETKKLFFGLISIVTSVGNIRNQIGDCHGHGQNRIEITKNYTELVVNSTKTITYYLLSFYQKELFLIN